MKVTSYIKSIISPELRKSVVNRGVIKPGDQLKAQIIDRKDNGKVLVDFGKFRSFAEVAFPVAKGTVIEVKVIDIGEQIKLKVIDPELKNLQGTDGRSGKPTTISREDLVKLRSHLKHIIESLSAVSSRSVSKDHINSILESIRSDLKPLVISGGHQQLAADIKSYLDTSGIFFEKKIEDAIFKTLLGAGDLTLDKLSQMTSQHRTVVGQFTSNLQALKAYFDAIETSAKSLDPRGLESLKNAVADLLADTGNLPFTSGEKSTSPSLSNMAELLSFFKAQAETGGILNRTDNLLSTLTSFLNDARSVLEKDLAALLGKLAPGTQGGDQTAQQTLVEGIKSFLGGPTAGTQTSGASYPDNIRDILSSLFSEPGAYKESAVPKPFDFLPQTAVEALSGLKSYYELHDLMKVMERLLSGMRALADRIPDIDAREMARLIAQVLESTDGAPSEKSGLTDRLQQLMNQDLKPNLFMLKALLEKNDEITKWVDPKALEHMKTAVGKLISDITGQQADAVNRQGRTDLTQVLTFSIPLEETRENARLKIYYPKKHKDASKEGLRISVLLDMDRLGEIRTDLHLLEKDLSITFFVQDVQKKISLENNFHDILHELKPDFDYLSVKAVVSEKKIEEFSSQDRKVSSDGMLDVRV